MNNIESKNTETPTIEALYEMKFPNIDSAKVFLEQHGIPLIWPSTRKDGHILTNANGKVGIGKLTEKARGGIRLTGLARVKIAYGDPNLSVQDIQDQGLTTRPEEMPDQNVSSSRGLIRKLFRGKRSKAA